MGKGNQEHDERKCPIWAKLLKWRIIMAKKAPAPVTFTSELVICNGVVSIEASVSEFRRCLIEAEEQDAALMIEIELALDEIFSRKIGAAIPIPNLQGCVAQLLKKDPTSPEYSKATECVLKYIRRNNQDSEGVTSKFLVKKGNGNGVYRRCDKGWEKGE
jgi:hypothetical protein